MKPACLALAFVLVAGSLCASTTQLRKLRVLTSILPIYCLTAHVAGDRAQVEILLPKGADAHDYQFAPRERGRLDAADVIFINGLEMEPWLEKVLGRAGAGPTMITCSAGLGSQLIYRSAW